MEQTIIKSRYDWVLFDADNTLFDFHASSEIAFHKSFGRHGMTVDNWSYERFRHYNLEAWKAFDENRMDHEEIKVFRFGHLFREMGIDHLDPLEFNALYFRQLVENIRYVSGAPEVLEELAGKLRLGLITNGMKEVQRPRLEASSIRHLFEVVVVSGEIGHSKPTSSYFDYVYERIGLPEKERVLVVGDNLYADIQGGRDFGFRTVWFNPAGVPGNNGVTPDYEIRSLQELRQLVN
jgi:YjjG family noncanonical pyrimidine nucleotidase